MGLMSRANKLQIGIDIRMSYHTGIGRYIRGLIPALLRNPSPWNYMVLGPESIAREVAPGHPFIRTSVPIYSAREQLILPWISRFCDCVHIPNFNAPIVNVKKLVITIHDLIYLYFSKNLKSPVARWYASALFPFIVKKADAIIAVSEHTKKDLVEMLRVAPEKITVIYHGLNAEFVKPNSWIISSAPPPHRYFLYVGLLKAHKNVGLLLEAFQQIRKRLDGSSLHLYLVGKADVKQPVVQRWLNIIQNDSNISLITNIDDQRLKELYWNATALVFPSLHEGFGFPLVEAMAAKLPIIAARSTSTPEVLGEAGIYFDPCSVSELMDQMEKILQSENLRQKLVQNGLARLRLFDWTITAMKTQQVYETVLGKN